MKFIDLDHAGNDKLLNQLLLSLGCWLMLARFCVFNAGLKVDVAREILTVIMTSNDENVRSCKRHTVVRRAFCFGRLLCPFLASRLTTVSLDFPLSLDFPKLSHNFSYQHNLKCLCYVLITLLCWCYVSSVFKSRNILHDHIKQYVEVILSH